jgi:hypothetical protein
VDTFFRIANPDVEFELEGSEEFVRRQMTEFLPHLSLAGEKQEATEAVSPLKEWYDRHFPRGRAPSMQDSILVFGYFLKREREQHMFTPSDLKRAFTQVGRKVPKSLLQIMGTLKRDHGLLWSPGDKRGVYALPPDGIRRVEGLLGIESPKRKAKKVEPPATPGQEPDDSSEHAPEKWKRLFGQGESGRD